MININLHSCSCIIDFIKLVANREVKCSANLPFYLYSSTCLINSIRHKHSYKILFASMLHSDFIWPFLSPYMGVIPNPKMAFIFPISCILVLIFPIFMIYFPKCEGKGSFPKSQIKSLTTDIISCNAIFKSADQQHLYTFYKKCQRVYYAQTRPKICGHADGIVRQAVPNIGSTHDLRALPVTFAGSQRSCLNTRPLASPERHQNC